MADATRSALRYATLIACAAASLSGCTKDLGECDALAAQELVYDRSGLVATKGQALLHDSCGQGSFCHSAAAKGTNRRGTPADLNFDMLPSPTGVARVIEQRELIWKTIEDGEMPPKGFTVGDSDWRFDVEHRDSAEKLHPLASSDGKAALRNWLACGAPTVADTRVPSWTSPARDTRSSAEVAWTDLHQKIRGTCVSAGCHDGLPPEDVDAAYGTMTTPFVAEECVVYRWLLFSRSACGERLVVGGDPDHSALVHKLEDERPACGDPMPPPSMPSNDKTAQHMRELKRDVRAWIQSGAFAPQCGGWSDSAPRTVGLDAGVAMGPPDWKKVHSDIIAPRCGTAGCHDAKTKAGDLELWDACGAYRALQGSGTCGKRLSAGTPEGSSFYLRMTSPDKIGNASCSAIMPPTGALPSAQINQIKAWIEAGAMADGC